MRLGCEWGLGCEGSVGRDGLEFGLGSGFLG